MSLFICFDYYGYYYGSALGSFVLREYLIVVGRRCRPTVVTVYHELYSTLENVSSPQPNTVTFSQRHQAECTVKAKAVLINPFHCDICRVCV